MQQHQFGILGVAMAGIMMISGVYIALRYSGNIGSIANTATVRYGQVGTQFQKGW